VNSLPKTVTGQRHGCDLNPGPTAPKSITLTTRLPSHPIAPAVYSRTEVLQYVLHQYCKSKHCAVLATLPKFLFRNRCLSVCETVLFPVTCVLIIS